MTTITIRTIGNPALYSDLRDAYTGETKHRTVSGAARQLLKLIRDSKAWAAASGQWGTIEVAINGATLQDMDAAGVIFAAQDEAGGDWVYEGETVKAMAAAAQRLAA